jgi:ferritin-like metal-binding protein YciE
MKIKDFRGLFETGLRYAYDCEQKLVKKGIPSMIEASTSTELRNALEQHLQETQNHVTRLERVFSLVGAEAKTEDNDIIDEMKDAADDMVSATEEGSPLRDAALIVAGNSVEHYEMAMYGSLVSFARQLGLSEVASVLEQTLNEEKAADAKLTQIGETSVNPTAVGQVRRAA